jgi:hypothetical protein
MVLDRFYMGDLCTKALLLLTNDVSFKK